MLDFYGKVLALCKKKGVTITKCAEECGLAQSTPTRWKQGAVPRPAVIKKIADYFGVSVSYFDENEAISDVRDLGTVIDAPIYTAPLFEAVSAGFGAYADDHIIDRVPIYASCRQEAEETICIRVSGESMYPKIEDGDIIQVHKQESVDSGSIAVLMIDGEDFLVKKIVYGEDGVTLESINPTFPPRRYRGEDARRVSVVGRVTKIIKTV